MSSHTQTVLYFVRAHRRLYGLLLVVMVGAALLDGISLAAFLPLFLMFSGEARAVGGLKGLMASIVQRIPVSDPVVAAAALVVTTFALKIGLGLLRDGLSASANGKVLRAVKNRLFQQYARSPYQFFLDSKQGHLLYQSLSAPNKVAALLLKLPQAMAEILKMIAILAVLALVFPVGTILLTVCAFAYYCGVKYLARNVSYTLGEGRVKASTDEEVLAIELLSGIRQITAFRTIRYWTDRLAETTRTYTMLYARDLVWLSIPKQLAELVAVVLLVLCIFAVRREGEQVLAAALPQLAIFATGVMQLLPSITAIGRIRMELLGALPDTEMVRRALEQPITVRSGSGRRFQTLRSGIEFEGVWFRHAGRDPVLKGLNARFEKGQWTALVGASGAGKSTIVNLLLGFFEPSSGRILIDGVPVTEYELDSWLAKVGLVTQDPFLIHGTIRENITFGRPEVTFDQVIHATRTAHADAFISTLPQGYDTVVGERGMKLSGGQQQRICIARALLGDPEVLIFDEATSSLDGASEAVIQQTIASLSKDYTLIVIAHRPSSIVGATSIVVLEDGVIREEGDHHELLRQGGRYAKLFAVSQ
jgi:ABC-type multidrug transport system fused ATPase/permease subunit